MKDFFPPSLKHCGVVACDEGGSWREVPRGAAMPGDSHPPPCQGRDTLSPARGQPFTSMPGEGHPWLCWEAATLSPAGGNHSRPCQERTTLGHARGWPPLALPGHGHSHPCQGKDTLGHARGWPPSAVSRGWLRGFLGALRGFEGGQPVGWPLRGLHRFHECC